ncbi:MAG: glycoside hydrolase family 5 protein [Saccharofermentans sp.]|nr:glycoside hydrolase family 5 protein [Saccharofermentans sp.]
MRQLEGFVKGINLGGWISQYEKFDKHHFDTFITRKDIEKIASWGLDHVRVPVDYEVLEMEDGSIRENGYEYLDNCLVWCRKYGLKMIIDLHRAYGYTFDPMNSDDKEKFFLDSDLQERFYKIWDVISKRYAEDSDDVAFELLNEIVSRNIYKEWNEIALNCISVIRKNAPNNWIIFGGTDYNSVNAIPNLPNVDDMKVAYTFHCYDPFMFTHQGCHWVDTMPRDFRINYPASLDAYRLKDTTLSENEVGGLKVFAQAFDNERITAIDPSLFEIIFEPAIKTCEERNIPVYVGEYGVIDIADYQSKINWLKDINSVFEKYNMARSYWSYRKMNFGIEGEDHIEVIDNLVKLL